MITKEQAKEIILNLIDRFEEQYDSYKKSTYGETQTRRDFIDPFFKALGWDVDNSQGYAEAYREVIHEDKLKIGDKTKAPDYSFKLAGGKRLFFLEAKKPSVDVKVDIDPAYQLRRYGWSAKMPISILTDFEEFAVYDCTKKPNPTDKASVARIEYFTFKDYESKFDFIWDTFSKEQVLKGSFDKYIKSDSNKKGTTTVDKEFLSSLDNWRILFAENLVKKNKDLDEDEINFIVQQTIDRIIFLRIAEDRGIETYGNLKKALNKGIYYDNLFQLFSDADQKYNSGLFDTKKDKVSQTIKIDNLVIKTIINQLYYPDSPYEFSVLSVEILGSAYEQFLGKTITITDKHKIVIEQKPEVRKAGGVYYTPQYIVEYIVQNTVGKLVEGKKPKEVSEITICDPACGSGSFLIGAYQFLLDWHKNYYTDNLIKRSVNDTSIPINRRVNPTVDIETNSTIDISTIPSTYKFKGNQKDNPLTPDGNLTTAEKKRILVNNIYGVDIDANAVEVTKLSLLLKCLEGETEASINNQTNLFAGERILPTLEKNILSGNSLIDFDFYENNLDFGEEKKIKPFSWQKSFPKVFKDKEVNEDFEAYHITCVTYNSRKNTSQYVSGITLEDNERELIAQYLDAKIKKEKYRVTAINILNDHIHLILVCNKNEIEKIVGQLKGFSSFEFHKYSEKINRRVNPTVDKPQYSDGTIKKLWASGYSKTFLNNEEHLINTTTYINNNHLKHNLKAIEFKFSSLTPYSEAFKPTIIKGGFDVVIGNPPWVDIKGL